MRKIEVQVKVSQFSPQANKEDEGFLPDISPPTFDKPTEKQEKQFQEAFLTVADSLDDKIVTSELSKALETLQLELGEYRDDGKQVGKIIMIDQLYSI